MEWTDTQPSFLLPAVSQEDDTKKMHSFRMADPEDVDSWRDFIVDVERCGLQEAALKLITTDGNPALLKVLKEIHPFRKAQRYIVHKLRNVATKLKRIHLKPCTAEVKDIFNTPSRREAIKRFKMWREKWQV